ncbi:MAG: hypothetical protein WD206_06405 [Actinomycetota bacterium]
MTAFRPEHILEVLERHAVEFVVIGGFAAVIHGAPHTTTDVDVTPSRRRDNLQRLSEALTELDARIRTVDEPEGLVFAHSASSLEHAGILNLVTTAGNLDLSFVPSGTGGFDDLRREAVRLRILGVDVSVASLGDVIRSKEAADREKDRVVLPVLRRILEEGGDGGTG